MTLRARSALFVMIGAALPVHATAQRMPMVDVILTGGRVFTADPRTPWAEAVAIRGDRVVAVGSSAELGRLAGASTRRIELGGRVVVPGFNDAHDHVGAAPYGVEFATSTEPTAGTFRRDDAGRLNGVLDEYAAWDGNGGSFPVCPHARSSLRSGNTPTMVSASASRPCRP